MSGMMIWNIVKLNISTLTLYKYKICKKKKNSQTILKIR